jgi:hypothetical protein
MKLTDCLWLQGELAQIELFRPITKSLAALGVKPVILPPKTDRAGWQALKEKLWKTDQHVMLHGLRANELPRLYPLFKARRNFSVLLVDWWSCPFWFTRHAEYVLFHIYSGIAARTQSAVFAGGWQPPVLSRPEGWVPYAIASAALRPVAWLAQPLLELRARQLRAKDVVRPERLIYFPIPISAEDLPFHDEKPEYDFCNVGSTGGFWVIRDPYVPSRYNFVNLYSDRKRLGELVLELDGRPYKIFDRRRLKELPSWELYSRSVRRSRFAIGTGGIHQASVPKYLEYACLGTPMIGATLPYEFPWLDQCVFPIDGLRVTREELPEKLKAALELQPKLRQNCLELRDTLLRMYHPTRIIEMAQGQMDGQPIPPGYLREGVA